MISFIISKPHSELFYLESLQSVFLNHTITSFPVFSCPFWLLLIPLSFPSAVKVLAGFPPQKANCSSYCGLIEAGIGEQWAAQQRMGAEPPKTQHPQHSHALSIQYWRPSSYSNGKELPKLTVHPSASPWQAQSMIQGNSIPHFPLPLNARSSSLSVNKEIRCSSASVKPDTPTDQKAILWCNKTFWILLVATERSIEKVSVF